MSFHFIAVMLHSPTATCSAPSPPPMHLILGAAHSGLSRQFRSVCSLSAAQKRLPRAPLRPRRCGNCDAAQASSTAKPLSPPLRLFRLRRVGDPASAKTTPSTPLWRRPTHHHGGVPDKTLAQLRPPPRRYRRFLLDAARATTTSPPPSSRWRCPPVRDNATRATTMTATCPTGPRLCPRHGCVGVTTSPKTPLLLPRQRLPRSRDGAVVATTRQPPQPPRRRRPRDRKCTILASASSPSGPLSRRRSRHSGGAAPVTTAMCPTLERLGSPHYGVGVLDSHHFGVSPATTTAPPQPARRRRPRYHQHHGAASITTTVPPPPLHGAATTKRSVRAPCGTHCRLAVHTPPSPCRFEPSMCSLPFSMEPLPIVQGSRNVY